MVTMSSCTSLLWLLVCCWCCVTLAEHRMSYTGDSEEDLPTKTTTRRTTTTTYAPAPPTTADARARCKDRIRNEDETDIDCGGILCPRCANTKACKNKCDCISGVCENNKCGGGGGNCVPGCKNNGKCIDGKCSCPTGYQGPTCETEVHGLCSAKDLVESEPILTVTFGNGNEQYSSKTPKDFDFSTTYKQQFEGSTEIGYFSILNSIPAGPFDRWHTGAKDHTGDEGGYMLYVNGNIQSDEFYRGTVKNLCVGRHYEFSVYLANVCKPNLCKLRTDVLFQVRTAAGNELLAELSSGDVVEYDTLTWKKYGLSFTATSKSVVLLMISKVSGGKGGGNYLALDDIALRVCGEGSGLCHADE